MTRPIVNIDEIELEPRPRDFAAPGEAAERFDARMGYVGRALGATQLGYNITAVPPGKRAFPLHNHHVNEEMFFVLEGNGELRFGDKTFPLRSGDFVACPVGGPDVAHQIVNTSDSELKFLAVSTLRSPEVCDYPDSGKFGVYAEWEHGEGNEQRALRFIGREGESKSYWDGE